MSTSSRQKNVYPNMAYVVNDFIQDVREHYSSKKFYIVQQDADDGGTVLRIRRGNWFSGFFGMNHDVRFSICTNGADMETEIRTSYLRLHLMLLLFIVLLLPPFIVYFVGTLPIMFLFWILFFILHLVGFLRQMRFAKKIRKYTERYCRDHGASR